MYQLSRHRIPVRTFFGYVSLLVQRIRQETSKRFGESRVFIGDVDMVLGSRA